MQNHASQLLWKSRFLRKILAISRLTKIPFTTLCCNVDCFFLVFQTIIYFLLACCTGGFVFLVSYWRPDWALKIKCSPCSLNKATHVLLKASNKKLSKCDLFGELNSSTDFHQEISLNCLKSSTMTKIASFLNEPF